MAKIERHHCIPVSFYGPDREENIIELSQEDHKLLHQKQNISHQSLRKFRMKTNHLEKSSDEFKEHWANVMLRYFAGSVYLPVRIIKLQARCLRTLVTALAKEKGSDVPTRPPGKMSSTQELLYWVVQLALICFSGAFLTSGIIL